MTAQEMLPAIGATVMVACESLNVACRVQDVKTSWGRARLLVRPLTGTGEQWVEMSRVSRGEVRTATEASKDHERAALALGYDC